MKTFVCIFLLGCGGTPGTPSSELGAERTGVSIRIVNVFSTGQGSPGPAVDVYRKQSASLGAKTEPAPIVSALAYGAVSAPFHPLAKTDVLRFFNAGTTNTATGYAGFEQVYAPLTDGDRVTIIIAGSSPGGAGAPLVPSWEFVVENRDANAPAVDPANALVVIDDVGINAYSSQNPGLYLGSGGTCLTSRGTSGTAPNLVVSGEKIYAFMPGNLSIGLFLNPASGVPDCTAGTEAFGPVTVSNAAAGSRTWLLLYGTSWSNKLALALPFIP